MITEAVAQALPAEVIEGVTIPVTPPKQPEHGDFATAAALALAKPARKKPRDIAEAIVEHIPTGDFIESVEIAGPGFINIRLASSFWQSEVKRLLEEGDAYGRSDVGEGHTVLVEYVSANPTGPVHVGHARNAAVGDTVCNLLDAAGWKVTREFYINDTGEQIAKLGKSVWYRYREAAGKGSFPEEGELYYGEYVKDLARLYEEQHGDAFLESDEPTPEAIQAAWDLAYPALLEQVRQTLKRFGVQFDRWFSESEVQGTLKTQTVELAGEQVEVRVDTTSPVWDTLTELQKRGEIFFEDGAVWFRATEHGDDKDRVLFKSDGNATYLLPDVAYHRNKLERGFETIVDVWGADHHGYIPRMRGAIEALGYDPDRFEVLIMQMVRLFRGKEELKMSKRAGEFVTLDDLIEEVGADAARFTLLTRTSDSPFDFDLEVAKSQSDENPVYYVQYGHARVCSLFAKAAEVSLGGASSADEALSKARDADVSRLTHDAEIAMVRRLEEFPETVAEAAERREPHRVVFYLQDLVRAFHAYYALGNQDASMRIVNPDDTDLSFARLALCAAIRQVLANGLALCGVEAPDHM